MTKGELARRVQIELDDMGYKFFNIDDLYDSIDDGLLEISAYTEFLEGTSNLTLSNLTFYKLSNYITNYLRLISVFNNSTNSYLEPVSLETIKEISPRWISDIGQPRMFTVVGIDTFIVYPKRSGVVLRLNYKRLANDVTEIPEQFIDVLELYVISDMLDQLEEYAKSVQYFKQYQERLAVFKKEVENRASRMPMLRP